LRGWLCGRLELAQRRAQRIEARGVGKPVVLYEAPERRGYSGKLVVGEANCRGHDALPSMLAIDLSSAATPIWRRDAAASDQWGRGKSCPPYLLSSAKLMRNPANRRRVAATAAIGGKKQKIGAQS
jgi:hypothetical protein